LRRIKSLHNSRYGQSMEISAIDGPLHDAMRHSPGPDRKDRAFNRNLTRNPVDILKFPTSSACPIFHINWSIARGSDNWPERNGRFSDWVSHFSPSSVRIDRFEAFRSLKLCWELFQESDIFERTFDFREFAQKVPSLSQSSARLLRSRDNRCRSTLFLSIVDLDRRQIKREMKLPFGPRSGHRNGLILICHAI
jgi:hypothetical protein